MVTNPAVRNAVQVVTAVLALRARTRGWGRIRNVSIRHTWTYIKGRQANEAIKPKWLLATVILTQVRGVLKNEAKENAWNPLNCGEITVEQATQKFSALKCYYFFQNVQITYCILRICICDHFLRMCEFKFDVVHGHALNWCLPSCACIRDLPNLSRIISYGKSAILL